MYGLLRDSFLAKFFYLKSKTEDNLSKKNTEMHKYCITLLDFHLASEAEARSLCIGISERI
ncbi:MAG: hypothetical protein JETT_1224 [Candidatus Jettenia ecosi]|uniref:Uncharacterized protein n=1 Tax=Candidatus Jettenia ecosi TaxID=2494326 RepID=A0A533QIF8_9BACT|nr:MAG: hypothetical protein JETT_1224 [Candidatus Jettenia ecosi]